MLWQCPENSVKTQGLHNMQNLKGIRVSQGYPRITSRATTVLASLAVATLPVPTRSSNSIPLPAPITALTYAYSRDLQTTSFPILSTTPALFFPKGYLFLFCFFRVDNILAKFHVPNFKRSVAACNFGFSGNEFSPYGAQENGRILTKADPKWAETVNIYY